MRDLSTPEYLIVLPGACVARSRAPVRSVVHGLSVVVWVEEDLRLRVVETVFFCLPPFLALCFFT